MEHKKLEYDPRGRAPGGLSRARQRHSRHPEILATAVSARFDVVVVQKKLCLRVHFHPKQIGQGLFFEFPSIPPISCVFYTSFNPRQNKEHYK